MEEKAEERDALFRRIYSSAIKILSVRDHSRSEIRKKLVLKGFDEDLTDMVIQKLVESGYIKEAELASRYASNMLDKGYGRFRIRMKMQERGLDEDDSEKALESYCSHDDELDSAISAGLKKIRSIKDDDLSKVRLKLSRFLVSRGFDYDITREAVNRVMAEDEFDQG